MEIEYSFEVKGQEIYRFTDWEKEQIAQSLKPLIKKLEKKIQKIDEDPENEGQVDFLEAKREVRAEIESIKEIIKEFSK